MNNGFVGVGYAWMRRCWLATYIWGCFTPQLRLEEISGIEGRITDGGDHSELDSDLCTGNESRHGCYCSIGTPLVRTIALLRRALMRGWGAGIRGRSTMQRVVLDRYRGLEHRGDGIVIRYLLVFSVWISSTVACVAVWSLKGKCPYRNPIPTHADLILVYNISDILLYPCKDRRFEKVDPQKKSVGLQKPEAIGPIAKHSSMYRRP